MTKERTGPAVVKGVPTLQQIMASRGRKESLAGPDPIFKPGQEGILKTSLAENYIDCILASGSKPEDMEFFDRFLNGLVLWLTCHSARRLNLLIAGPPGVGKTALMTALYRTMTVKGCNPHWISAKDINDIYRGKGQFYGWKEINQYRFLFVDDVGMEDDVVNDYGNRTAPMLRMLHNRYDRNLVTVFTTNLNWEEICDRYGNRVSDRLSNYHRLMYEHYSFRGRRGSV